MINSKTRSFTNINNNLAKIRWNNYTNSNQHNVDHMNIVYLRILLVLRTDGSYTFFWAGKQPIELKTLLSLHLIYVIQNKPELAYTIHHTKCTLTHLGKSYVDSIIHSNDIQLLHDLYRQNPPISFEQQIQSTDQESTENIGVDSQSDLELTTFSSMLTTLAYLLTLLLSFGFGTVTDYIVANYFSQWTAVSPAFTPFHLAIFAFFVPILVASICVFIIKGDSNTPSSDVSEDSIDQNQSDPDNNVSISNYYIEQIKTYENLHNQSELTNNFLHSMTNSKNFASQLHVSYNILNEHDDLTNKNGFINFLNRHKFSNQINNQTCNFAIQALNHSMF